jgi:hypothetical protein
VVFERDFYFYLLPTYLVIFSGELGVSNLNRSWLDIQNGVGIMEEIKFDVQGSAAAPYSVVFLKKSDVTFSASCSCPAGIFGKYCKHRFSILGGNKKGIVSDNLEQVELVQSWVKGTDVERALIQIKELDIKLAQIKKELAASKKLVAKAMRS